MPCFIIPLQSYEKKTSLYHLPFTIWAHEWNYWRFLMGDDVCVSGESWGWCGTQMNPFSDGIPLKASFHRKRLQGRFQTFAGTVANVYDGGCKRLRKKMQCTAEAVAVHCGDGCSALRLRWRKLALKSSALFWIREKGWKTHPAGHYSPHDFSTEPSLAPWKNRRRWPKV